MNNDGSQAVHDARDIIYAGVALNRHPCLAEAYHIACLIEACGASEALTRASCAAFDSIAKIDQLVRVCEARAKDIEDLKGDLEAERDKIERLEAESVAWRIMAQQRGKIIEAHGLLKS